MINKIKNSLSAKLLILLFLIGFIPYLLILVYTKVYGQAEILESTIVRESVQMQQIEEAVEMHLQQLHRGLLFLAHLELMDDIVVDDLDHRILQTLEAYHEVLGLEATLLVVNDRHHIVASTEVEMIDQPYADAKDLSHQEEFQVYTVDEGKILFVVPLFSQLDSGRELGHLVMEYAVENLQRFNLNSSGVTTGFINQQFNYRVSTQLLEPFELQKGRYQSEDSETLTLYRPINSMLTDWYLIYQLDKSVVFSFLEQLNLYLIIGAIFGMATIAMLAFYMARRVVYPLKLLQEQTKEMVAQHRYDLKVPTLSNDEVGQLALSFNALSDDIESVMAALKEESQLRMLRLTQLIALFHKLLSSQHEQSCLQIALHALQKIVPEHKVTFKVIDENAPLPAIYLYDFEHQRELYYGSLSIDFEYLQEEEKEFFLAAAAMITARLNQLRAYNRLQKDDEAKRTFISYLSHELRTPLHAILTQTQYLIGYESLNEIQLDKIAHIENSSQQLLSMINDLLDLAKLEAGKYDLQLETVACEEIVESVASLMQMLAPLAEQKGLTYTLTSECTEVASVIDLRLLRRVVSNLLSNAIKFTQKGQIACSVNVEKEQIVIMIADSGCGIEQKALGSLCDPFVQYGDASQIEKGSGVGLALSQRYAALFGATLEISSDGLGKGATARVTMSTI